MHFTRIQSDGFQNCHTYKQARPQSMRSFSYISSYRVYVLQQLTFSIPVFGPTRLQICKKLFGRYD